MGQIRRLFPCILIKIKYFISIRVKVFLYRTVIVDFVWYFSIAKNNWLVGSKLLSISFAYFS
jgi:hypothetical protein